MFHSYYFRHLNGTPQFTFITGLYRQYHPRLTRESRRSRQCLFCRVLEMMEPAFDEY